MLTKIYQKNKNKKARANIGSGTGNVKTVNGIAPNDAVEGWQNNIYVLNADGSATYPSLSAT